MKHLTKRFVNFVFSRSPKTRINNEFGYKKCAVGRFFQTNFGFDEDEFFYCRNTKFTRALDVLEKELPKNIVGRLGRTKPPNCYSTYGQLQKDLIANGLYPTDKDVVETK